MKVAVISSVYYPEISKGKYDIVTKAIKYLEDYAGVDYELFVMNDGTEDDRFDSFMTNYSNKGYCKDVHFTTRENKGITKSLNELLHQVDDSFDYICLLDMDTLLPVYWLKKCISVLKQNESVGMCGVLVEDELDFDFKSGILRSEEGVLYCHVNSIGGACLVFRAEELKHYGFDEDLVSDHVDAYIITRYRLDGKSSYSILERGAHEKQIYESPEYIQMKLDRFHKELPKFQQVVNKYKK